MPAARVISFFSALLFCGTGTAMAQSCADGIDPKKPILQIIQCLESIEEKNSELQAKLAEVLSKPGIPGPEGKQGPQGVPGIDGIDGKDGANGESADFPKGAVVAFDLRDGCPVGWETFADAMGRVLIGSDPPDWTGGEESGFAQTTAQRTEV